MVRIHLGVQTLKFYIMNIWLILVLIWFGFGLISVILAIIFTIIDAKDCKKQEVDFDLQDLMLASLLFLLGIIGFGMVINQFYKEFQHKTIFKIKL